jgi:hypothetical protein
MTENIMIPAGGMITQAPPSDDFNRYIQEMSKQIKEMELYLMGEKESKDENGVLQRIKYEKPLVNEAGKNSIINWLQCYLTPNTYMSYIKGGDTFNNFVLDVDDLADDLTVKHKEYGLDRANMWALHSRLCFIFFMALRKAETDKKYIYQNMRTNYQPTNEEQKPAGLFGGLFK